MSIMRNWQIQRLSAVALLFFLTTHMVVVHYPPFHITFDRILERMANPVWKTIDILFLAFVLAHALSGVWAVVTDYDALYRWRKLIGAVAVVAGIAAFIFGAMTIMTFQPAGV
ncbi:MAG: succinate dehydrogenase, hydrophobic membrane anchor protein [Chloroflexota bacterium]|nr:succinate dehydrogenase, hydrophobic membrane anchor protein [Chloroflexota bacterium]